MIKLLIFIILNSFACAWNANASVELPNELFTVENISNEIRSQISILLGDLQKNYSIVETIPGENIIFRDSSNKNILEISVKQDINTLKTFKRIILEMKTETKNLFKEEILISGTDLKKSDALKRMFLKDSSKELYGLEENELSKQVNVSVDQTVLVSLKSYRVNTDNTSAILNVVNYGSSNVFTIKISTLNNSNTKMVEYISNNTAFQFNYFGSKWKFGNPNTTSFKVIQSHISGYLTDQVNFYKENSLLNNLSTFLNEFNSGFYVTYINMSLHDAMQVLVTEHFPKVEKIKGFSSSSKFSDELNLLLSQLDQAKTNPTMLDKVTKKIREINDAVQAGLISVTDNRPAAIR